MNLDHLEQLIAFHEYGTLSSASEALLISQPALTRNMQKLEESLNVKMFNRQKNKIELNETGAYVVEKSKVLLQQVQQFNQDIQQFDKNNTIISVGICAPGIDFEIAHRIHHEQYDKQLKIEQIADDQLTEKLLDQTYDIVITEVPIEKDNVISEPYFKEVLNLSLPKHHPLCSKKQVMLEDFIGLTMLLRTELGIWDKFIQQLTDTTFIYQDNSETFKQLVEASDLPVFTTNITVEYGISAYARQHIPVKAPFSEVTFYLNTLAHNKTLLEYIK